MLIFNGLFCNKRMVFRIGEFAYCGQSFQNIFFQIKKCQGFKRYRIKKTRSRAAVSVRDRIRVLAFQRFSTKFQTFSYLLYGIGTIRDLIFQFNSGRELVFLITHQFQHLYNRRIALPPR